MAGTLEISEVKLVSPNGLVEKTVSVDNNGIVSSGANQFKIGKNIYNWYAYSIVSGNRYIHLKTNLWGGGSPAGNIQAIMPLFHIKGYDYRGHTIDSMVGFHNWSGSVIAIAYKNSGSLSVTSAPYVSTDGYVVLVIDTNTAPNYFGISIDYIQSVYQDTPITVTATANTVSATGAF